MHYVDLGDLAKSIHLQNLISIQPRTDRLKFGGMGYGPLPHPSGVNRRKKYRSGHDRHSREAWGRCERRCGAHRDLFREVHGGGGSVKIELQIKSDV